MAAADLPDELFSEIRAFRKTRCSLSGLDSPVAMAFPQRRGLWQNDLANTVDDVLTHD